MEFWGVEVKPNESLKCEPGDEKYLHLSQVSLGEIKKDKGAENVTVFVKFNDQKVVLGTLSAEKFPQISYDLVFEKEFELSHSSKNTSLYFCGYKTATMDEHSDLSGDEFESDEEPVPMLSANGKFKDGPVKPAAAKAATGKADASSSKPKAKTEEPIKADKPNTEADDEDDDDEDDDEDDEDIDEDDSDDEDMLVLDSDEEDDEDNFDEEEEETPKKVESAKKRSSGSASKTPVPAKKAKVVSPVGAQKTGGDGKKGGHTATPHPAKQSGKTPASGDKSKQQTPKSAGSVACKSCSKTFNSENALQAHTKAKHTAAK